MIHSSWTEDFEAHDRRDLRDDFLNLIMRIYLCLMYRIYCCVGRNFQKIQDGIMVFNYFWFSQSIYNFIDWFQKIISVIMALVPWDKSCVRSFNFEGSALALVVDSSFMWMMLLFVFTRILTLPSLILFIGGSTMTSFFQLGLMTWLEALILIHLLH